MGRRTPEQMARDRKAQLGACSKEVRRVAREMLKGQDRAKIADFLGVLEDTLADKANQGRFSAAELFMLAHLCGYTLAVVPRHGDLLD